MQKSHSISEIFPSLLFPAKTNNNNLQPQKLSATAEQCLALSSELAVEGIKALDIYYEGQSSDYFCFTGKLEATLVLVCCFSAEPFDFQISFDYNVSFVPEHQLPKLENDNLESEPLFKDGSADLGAYLIGLLALEIPAYPKSPAAIEQDDSQDLNVPRLVWADPNAEPEQKPNPFDALDQLASLDRRPVKHKKG